MIRNTFPRWCNETLEWAAAQGTGATLTYHAFSVRGQMLDRDAIEWRTKYRCFPNLELGLTWITSCTSPSQRIPFRMRCRGLDPLRLLSRADVGRQC